MKPIIHGVDLQNIFEPHVRTSLLDSLRTTIAVTCYVIFTVWVLFVKRLNIQAKRYQEHACL